MKPHNLKGKCNLLTIVTVSLTGSLHISFTTQFNINKGNKHSPVQLPCMPMAYISNGENREHIYWSSISLIDISPGPNNNMI